MGDGACRQVVTVVLSTENPAGQLAEKIDELAAHLRHQARCDLPAVLDRVVARAALRRRRRSRGRLVEWSSK
jgi:hypothetical protein